MFRFTGVYLFSSRELINIAMAGANPSGNSLKFMKNRATAIILRNGQILLIRRQKPGQDYYILPGGGVELDESFEEACRREVMEETGLDVLGLQAVHRYFYGGGEEVYFIARVPEGEPLLGGVEARRQSEQNRYTFEWADAGRLAELNVRPAAARRICLEILNRFARMPNNDG